MTIPGRKEYFHALHRFDELVFEGYDMYCSERRMRDPGFRPFYKKCPDFNAYPNNQYGITAKLLLDYFDGSLDGRRVLDVGSGGIFEREEAFFPAVVVGLGGSYLGTDPAAGEYTEELLQRAGYSVIRVTGEELYMRLEGNVFDAVVTLDVLGQPTFKHSGDDVYAHKINLVRLAAGFGLLTADGGVNVHYLGTIPKEADTGERLFFEGLNESIFKRPNTTLELCEIRPGGFIVIKKGWNKAHHKKD